MAYHRAQITTDAEINAARLLAAVDPRLHGDGDLFAEPFFVNDGANNVVGNAGAEIDDAAGRQIAAGYPPDKFAQVERQRRALRGGQLDIAAQRRIEVPTGGLAVIHLRLFAHHNGVNQVAGNGDAFRMQRAFRHAIFHLRQHLRPIASGGENRVQNFQLHHLFIGREVAVFISMGAAHNDHVGGMAG